MATDQLERSQFAFGFPYLTQGKKTKASCFGFPFFTRRSESTTHLPPSCRLPQVAPKTQPELLSEPHLVFQTVGLPVNRESGARLSASSYSGRVPFNQSKPPIGYESSELEPPQKSLIPTKVRCPPFGSLTKTHTQSRLLASYPNHQAGVLSIEQ